MFRTLQVGDTVVPFEDLVAVSYTHLDVYKRQVCECITAERMDRCTEILLNIIKLYAEEILFFNIQKSGCYFRIAPTLSLIHI